MAKDVASTLEGHQRGGQFSGSGLPPAALRSRVGLILPGSCAKPAAPLRSRVGFIVPGTRAKPAPASSVERDEFLAAASRLSREADAPSLRWRPDRRRRGPAHLVNRDPHRRPLGRAVSATDRRHQPVRRSRPVPNPWSWPSGLVPYWTHGALTTSATATERAGLLPVVDTDVTGRADVRTQTTSARWTAGPSCQIRRKHRPDRSGQPGRERGGPGRRPGADHLGRDGTGSGSWSAAAPCWPPAAG